MYGYPGAHSSPLSLLLGISGITFGALFFIQKFGLMTMTFDLTGEMATYIFAGFTLIAGVMLLMKALGLDQMHRMY